MMEIISRKETHAFIEYRKSRIPYLEIGQVVKAGPRSKMGYAVQFTKYGPTPILSFDAKGGEVYGCIEMTEKDLDQIIAWATACKECLEPVEDKWTASEVKG